MNTHRVTVSPIAASVARAKRGIEVLGAKHPALGQNDAGGQDIDMRRVVSKPMTEAEARDLAAAINGACEWTEPATPATVERVPSSEADGY